VTSGQWVAAGIPTGTLIIGFLTVYFGRKAGRETNLTELIKHYDTASNAHIDQLQEDVDRYRNMAIANELRVAELQTKLTEERHGRINAVAGQKAAIVIIERLELENQTLREHADSLEKAIERLKSARRDSTQEN
jgi:hypothetical protein